MKKRIGLVIQVSIRHPVLKYESWVGDLGVATGGGFSSGHPGFDIPGVY